MQCPARRRTYFLTGESFRNTRMRSRLRKTRRRELLMCNPPLYLIKPSLRNLFMKKLTRLRVVPTISANVSWDSFATSIPAQLSSTPKPLSSPHGNAVGNLWAVTYTARRNLVFDTGFEKGLTSTSTRWEAFAGLTYSRFARSTSSAIRSLFFLCARITIKQASF